MNDNVAYTIPEGYMGEYITNIPWDKFPAFAFSNDTNGYLKAFRNVVEVIPIGNRKILFDDDVWDFSPYFNRTHKNGHVLNFDSFPIEIRDYLKFYVLYSTSNNNKITTTHTRLNSLKNVLNRITHNSHHIVISAISEQQIIEEVNNKDITAQTKYNYYYAAFSFFSFLKNNYHLDIALDLEKLKKIMDKESIIRKKQQDNNKLSNIPEPYFQHIRNMAINIMRDNESSYNDRVTSALLVILTDTGLRVGDLTTLEINDLKTKKLSKSGYKVSFIHYHSEKPSPAHGKTLEFDIFCTSLCEEAFNTLLQLRKTCSLSSKSNFLYILEPYGNSGTLLPVSTGRFLKKYRRLIENNLYNDCSHSWDDAIKPSNGEKHPRVYIPVTEQYRVHICSFLYNEKHLPLTWIQRYMGHLSEAMLGYYVRPAENYQEDLAPFGKVIKEIQQEKLKPLGGDGNGSDLVDRINKYLENNNITATTDIQEIANIVQDHIIIRAKAGGFCIKTSLMPCARDARSDEIMCAYDLCPNLFHFFYMAGISYKNFINLQDSVNINIKRGLIRAAQKELNKLHNYLNRRLIPELDELDKEISDKGVNSIIEKYPDLIEIIENEESIRKEIENWKSKKING